MIQGNTTTKFGHNLFLSANTLTGGLLSNLQLPFAGVGAKMGETSPLNETTPVKKIASDGEYPNYAPGHYMYVRPEFHELMASIPGDLTSFDMSPFYDLTESRGERFALNRLQREWQPDPENLGDEYNGPLAEQGEPLRENVRKWEAAKADEPRRKREKLSADFLVACDKGIENPLVKATCEMMKVAFGREEEDGTCEDESPFEDLQN